MTQNPRVDWYIRELVNQIYTEKNTVTHKENYTWSWFIIFGTDLKRFLFNLFFIILDSELVNHLKHMLQCKRSLKTCDPSPAFQSLPEKGDWDLHLDENIKGYLTMKCLWVSFSNNLICSSGKTEVARLCQGYVMISVLIDFHGC